MSKRISILFFLVLSLLLFLFWKKPPSSYPKEPAIESSFETKGQKLPEPFSPSNNRPSINNPKKAISLEIYKCLPEASNIHTLDDFYSYIKKTESLQEETLEEELWHFSDNEGQKFRAQLLYFKDKKEFKLFKVHPDGLPDPIPLNKEESFNPSPTTLSKYIPKVSPVWYQKKSTIKTAKESLLSVELTNSKVTKLEYFLAEKAIHCSSEECFCSTNK